MIISCASWPAMGAGQVATLARIQDFLQQSEQAGASLALFPGLCVSEVGDVLPDKIRIWSAKHPRMAVCPGSAYLERDGRGYHAAALFLAGEELLSQRQIYLSRWERNAGVSRGESVRVCRVGDMTVAIVLSTDVFYPQVASAAVEQGAQLLINPAMNIRSGGAWPYAGMWQLAQQFHVYAAENPFRGTFFARSFGGEAAVYAPLSATERGDGILAHAQEGQELLLADCSPEALRKARASFDPRALHGSPAYRDLFAREGDVRAHGAD